MTAPIAAILRAVAPQAPPGWAPALAAAAPVAGIDTARESAHWLAQLAHESAGFTRFEEQLSYSAARIREVWPSRFPTLAGAQAVARDPQALANRVYNGRMGNRVGSDDGWHFRGRGPKQLTGRENYTRFERWLTERGRPAPIRTSPDLLLAPEHGALSAAWFWFDAGLGAILAARPNERAACEALTRRINGGTIGLPDRWARTQRALIAAEGSA